LAVHLLDRIIGRIRDINIPVGTDRDSIGGLELAWTRPLAAPLGLVESVGVEGLYPVVARIHDEDAINGGIRNTGRYYRFCREQGFFKVATRKPYRDRTDRAFRNADRAVKLAISGSRPTPLSDKGYRSGISGNITKFLDTVVPTVHHVNIVAGISDDSLRGIKEAVSGAWAAKGEFESSIQSQYLDPIVSGIRDVDISLAGSHSQIGRGVELAVS